MGRKIDITEKLNFEEAPALLIQGKEIHVNDRCGDDAVCYAAHGEKGTISGRDYEGL